MQCVPHDNTLSTLVRWMWENNLAKRLSQALYHFVIALAK